MEKGSAHEKTIRHLAHVRCDGDTFALHDLDEHLHGVGKLAEEYAQVFGSRRFCREEICMPRTAKVKGKYNWEIEK